MKIRIAKQEDIFSIDTIYNQAIELKRTADLSPYTNEVRQKWFAEHDASKFPIYVAEEAGKVVGWISISAYRPGRMALRNVVEVSYYLDATHLRKGIGSKLLQFAIDISKKLGYKNMVAILLENNFPSIKLLEKNDFQKWAHLPDVAEFDGELVGHVYYGKRINN